MSYFRQDSDVDWAGYNVCVACRARKGQPCHNLENPNYYNKRPHRYRKRFIDRRRTEHRAGGVR